MDDEDDDDAGGDVCEKFVDDPTIEATADEEEEDW